MRTSPAIAASRQPNADERRGLLTAVLPLAEVARRNVRAAVEACAVVDREPVLAALEEHLFRRLFAAASKTLVLELAVARRRSLLAGDTPEERFAFFCECLADRAFAESLLAQYPVLVKRLGRLIALWAEASRELLARLEADLATIRTGMFGGDPGLLIEAEPLGDSHAGGRCVHRLVFAGGSKLIYKPRPVGMERGVQSFTRWLNDKGHAPVLDALAVIDRTDYGWTQHREAAPCETKAAVGRFFRRQGANIAIAHLLGGSDLHYENIIAAGEHPVIVDLETLFHDPTEADGLAPASAEAFRILGDSVTRTLLLPVRVHGSANAADISALGFVEGQEAPYVAHDWADAQADTMHMAERRGSLPAARCLPMFQGKAIAAGDHLGEITEGFSHTYDLLVRHRSGLPRALAAFRGRMVRKVFRPTSTYVQALMQSWHPAYAGDRAALRKLLSEAMPSGDLPAAAIRKAEFAALTNGDIPYFLAPPDAGWNACLKRVKALSQEDKERQLWITRLSFADMNAGLPKSHRRAKSTESLVGAAANIGDRLCDLAITKGRRASWLFPMLDENVHLVPAVVGIDLYDGLAGIALFLGRLSLATGNKRHRAMAEAAAAEALDMLRILPKERLCPGGFEGTGGLAYALALLGGWLKRPEWKREAVRIIARDARRAERNADTDLISGRAGFLACGLAVAEIAGTPRLRERLRPVAESLLRLPRAQLPAAKDAGLAHGCAGLALALTRWGERGRARALLRSDLKECLGDTADGRHMVAWCRGGAGTALAGLRLGMTTGDAAERIAATTVERVSSVRGDTALCLCHGLFGLIEFLDEAARCGIPRARRGLEALRREATSRVLAGELCSDHAHRLDAPGLMKGLAGTGYALLRLADARVPSVLTVESGT